MNESKEQANLLLQYHLTLIKDMEKKILWIGLVLVLTSSLKVNAQYAKTDSTYKRCFVGSTMFLLGNSDKVTNEQISKVLKVGMRTIDRVKKQFIEEGMEAVLERRATTRIYDVKADGDIEAKLVTLCCSEPPKGFSKWSLRLLAEKMVELNYVESISHVTVRSVLKKMNLSLGK